MVKEKTLSRLTIDCPTDLSHKADIVASGMKLSKAALYARAIEEFILNHQDYLPAHLQTSAPRPINGTAYPATPPPTPPVTEGRPRQSVPNMQDGEGYKKFPTYKPVILTEADFEPAIGLDGKPSKDRLVMKREKWRGLEKNGYAPLIQFTDKITKAMLRRLESEIEDSLPEIVEDTGFVVQGASDDDGYYSEFYSEI
jgi:hypothetical protein